MAFPTIPTTGAGRVLTTTQTGTSSTRTFPSLSSLTKNSGDTLIAIIVGYQSSLTSGIFSSWGAGFTEVRDIGVASQHCIGVAYKISDGTETGTFTVTQGGTVTGDAAMILLSIPGGHLTTAPEVSAALATGTSAAADPAALDPANWGAEDTLWIAVAGSGETSTTGSYTGIASAPTNYGDYADTGISQDAVGGVEAAVAFRQLNASSENVGTFSVDVSNARNCAFVIAVRPLPAATPLSVGGAITPAGAIAKRTDRPLAGTLAAGYAAAVNALSPVGYWRLGEPSGTTATDEVGANDGTYVDSPTLGVAGLIGGDADTAADFNANSHVSVADVTWFDGTARWTIVAWIEHTSTPPGWQRIVSKEHFTGGHNGIAIFSQENEYGVERALNGNTVGAKVTSGIPAGAHMIAAVYGTDDRLRLYLDGTEVAVGAVDTQSIANSTTPLFISGREGPADRFDGVIDEVAIFQSALTAQQVADLYAAAGRFPLVAGTAGSGGGSAVTDHVVTLPGSISAGDRLLLLWAVNGNPAITGPSGWTEVVPPTANGTNHSIAAWERIATGSEGSTVTVTTDAAQRSEAYVLRLTGVHASAASEAATPVGSSASSTPDPPSLTPSWGAANTLWIAFGGSDKGSDGTLSATGFPANYTDGVSQSGNTSTAGVLLYLARRELNAATEDPGTFTTSIAENPLATTIAIRPRAEGSGIAGTLGISLDTGPTITAGGAIAPAAALARRTAFTEPAGLTPGGVLARRTSDAYAGSATSTGSLARRTGDAYAGSIASAGSVARTQTHARTWTGSIASSGALARRLARTLAGAVASVGSMTRVTGDRHSGAVTPTGTTAASKVTVRAYAGSTSTAGALTRRTADTHAGTVASAGVLTRRTGRGLAGAVTPAATLAAIRAYLRSFAGAISAGATLVVLPQKGIAGAIGPTGALTRRLGRALAGSAAGSGTLAVARLYVRAVAGSVVPAGTLTRRTGSALAGLAGASGSLTRAIADRVAGSIAPGGTLAAEVGRSFAVAGSIASAGTATLVGIFSDVTYPIRGAVARLAPKASVVVEGQKPSATIDSGKPSGDI